MSSKLPPVFVKLTISATEAKDLDKAISEGVGSSRADVCRKAMILYMENMKKIEAVA